VVIATYVGYRALVPDPAAEIADVPHAALLLLGIGTTLGVLALALPLLVPARRTGVRLRPTLRFPDGVGRRVRVLAVSGLLAVAGQQVATLVVIRLANDRGGAGTLNVYTYAQAVTLLPYAVLAVPLATAAFPSLARQHAAGDGVGETVAATATGVDDAPAQPEGAVRTLRQAWLATLVVGLFGAALLVAVAVPVGAFFSALDVGSASDASAETLAAMGDAVTLFAPSVAALGVVGLLTRASYVHGSPLAAGALAATGWLATLVLPLLVLAPEGAGGPDTVRALAAGSSIGLVLAAVLLAVLVGRAWGPSALAVPPRPLLAALAGSAAAALAGRGVASWLAVRGIGTSLGSSVVVGVGVGLLALMVMVGLALAVDPSVLRRLARRPRRSQTAARVRP
jgi:putative peptidoglycan lipid II flippase